MTQFKTTQSSWPPVCSSTAMSTLSSIFTSRKWLMRTTTTLALSRSYWTRSDQLWLSLLVWRSLQQPPNQACLARSQICDRQWRKALLVTNRTKLHHLMPLPIEWLSILGHRRQPVRVLKATERAPSRTQRVKISQLTACHRTLCSSLESLQKTSLPGFFPISLRPRTSLN